MKFFSRVDIGFHRLCTDYISTIMSFHSSLQDLLQEMTSHLEGSFGILLLRALWSVTLAFSFEIAAVGNKVLYASPLGSFRFRVGRV